MEIQSEILRTDVTSVAIIDNYVLSGMGGFISVHDISCTLLVARINVLGWQKVYGICKGPEKKLIAFGGRKFAVLNFDASVKPILLSERVCDVGDWIQCVKWLNDDNSIAVASAHNIVSLWNWRTGTRILFSVCEEKCLLYSSFFVGGTWKELIFLGGTVFREVIIWAPAENVNSDSPVLHRLKGHKGVIFSIHYNDNSGIIHTTSDDRSVRGWQVNLQQPDDWSTAEITHVYTLFGHTARVWKSIGLSNNTISIGEDSYLCIWDSSGKLLKRWSTHQGGRVWSVACREDDGLIVTGGSDGGINIWHLHYCLENIQPTYLAIPKEQFVGESGNEPIPRKVTILKSGRLITVLQCGKMICCSLCHRNSSCDVSKNDHLKNVTEWKEIYCNSELANYCLLEASPCRQLIAIATLNGQIIIFRELSDSGMDFRKEIEYDAVKGKIFSLHWLSSDMLLTCGACGKLELWTLERKEECIVKMNRLKEFSLPYSKERWLTSAILHEGLLICGDRIGSIHVFSIEIESSIEPHQTFLHLHGRFGVSSLVLCHTCLYSSGRNGILNEYHISKTERKLNLLCSSRLPFEWVASVFNCGSEIFVTGFSESKLVVWNQHRQCVLFELPCGGGHRSWDYAVQDNVLTFVHIRNKSLYFSSVCLDMYITPVLQTSFHPREVNCLHIIHVGRTSLFVSAGEDTTIHVTSALNHEKFATLAILRSHLSSVRTLTSMNLADNQILLFTAGGRAQLKAWLVSVETSDDLSCLSPYVVCQELTSHMLTDSNNKQRKPWRLMQPTVDPETRYMSLCIVPHPLGTFVGACSSDGLLRMFQYIDSETTLKLIGSYKFHDRCILKILYIGSCKVLTMATDGVVAFWDLQSLFDHLLCESNIKANENDKKEEIEFGSVQTDKLPFFTCKLHQSGINSSSALFLKADMILLATGGDDTALKLTVFQIHNSPPGVTQLLQYTEESAHVAQITGLTFIEKYLISTSVDQYICIWEWIYDGSRNHLSVSKIGTFQSTIADIHGLEVWKSGDYIYACVYGKGLEIVCCKA